MCFGARLYLVLRLQDSLSSKLHELLGFSGHNLLGRKYGCQTLLVAPILLIVGYCVAVCVCVF